MICDFAIIQRVQGTSCGPGICLHKAVTRAMFRSAPAQSQPRSQSICPPQPATLPSPTMSSTKPSRQPAAAPAGAAALHDQARASAAAQQCVLDNTAVLPADPHAHSCTPTEPPATSLEQAAPHQPAAVNLLRLALQCCVLLNSNSIYMFQPMPGTYQACPDPTFNANVWCLCCSILGHVVATHTFSSCGI